MNDIRAVECLKSGPWCSNGKAEKRFASRYGENAIANFYNSLATRFTCKGYWILFKIWPILNETKHILKVTLTERQTTRRIRNRTWTGPTIRAAPCRKIQWASSSGNPTMIAARNWRSRIASHPNHTILPQRRCSRMPWLVWSSAASASGDLFFLPFFFSSLDLVFLFKRSDKSEQVNGIIENTKHGSRERSLSLTRPFCIRFKDSPRIHMDPIDVRWISDRG